MKGGVHGSVQARHACIAAGDNCTIAPVQATEYRVNFARLANVAVVVVVGGGGGLTHLDGAEAAIAKVVLCRQAGGPAAARRPRRQWGKAEHRRYGVRGTVAIAVCTAARPRGVMHKGSRHGYRCSAHVVSGPTASVAGTVRLECRAATGRTLYHSLCYPVIIMLLSTEEHWTDNQHLCVERSPVRTPEPELRQTPTFPSAHACRCTCHSTFPPVRTTTARPLRPCTCGLRFRLNSLTWGGSVG